jgi:benzoyl-CoA reductase/2-hydroxyglutaryl-CoA dehydratase subunit BcrC/BadD/HgdB
MIGNPPNCDPAILDWLESEYGAVTVAMIQTDCLTEPIENMGDITEIFKGLAKRIMHLPMGRHGRLSADHFIDECIKMARDYKADGAIMLGHSGCKWNWASAYLVKDKINDELGIPVLNFEFDSVDSRFLSPEGMRAKFTEFFEIVFN